MTPLASMSMPVCHGASRTASTLGEQESPCGMPLSGQMGLESPPWWQVRGPCHPRFRMSMTFWCVPCHLSAVEATQRSTVSKHLVRSFSTPLLPGPVSQEAMAVRRSAPSFPPHCPSGVGGRFGRRTLVHALQITEETEMGLIPSELPLGIPTIRHETSPPTLAWSSVASQAKVVIPVRIT